MVRPVSTSALAGSLLVVGFDGVDLPSSIRALLARGERGGIIVFKRNLPDVAACARIAEDTRAACELEPLVAIDQEGGRVVRLPPPMRALPPMRVFADRDAALVRKAAKAVALDLRRLGYNLDFAPVLDVDSNPLNPVIGDRSFGRDPERVAELGVAFALGLNDGGVLSCGKHFPGHGDTDKDSHLELPIVHADRARLDAIELVPFRAAAKAGVDSLMTAHVVLDGVDRERPATLSPAIVTDLLRGELGYDGVVFSDDLEMRALADRMEVEASAVESLRAGCDAVLVCKSEALAARAHEAIAREIEASPAFRSRCEEAARRLTAMREKAARLRALPSEDAAPLFDDVARALEARVEVGRA